jgi:hypothetical protein
VTLIRELSIKLTMADTTTPAPAAVKPGTTRPKKLADHPPAKDMAKAAIAALKERTGSS